MKYILLFLLLPISFANELTVSVFGLAYHGLGVGNTGPKIPNKLDKSGALTMHPELNLTYINNNYLYNVTYLKNTYYKNAYNLGFGHRTEIIENLYYGAVGSLYVFEKTNRINEPRFFDMGDQGILILPWIFLQKDINLSKHHKLSFMLSSNYFLSHLTFGTTVNL